MDRTVRAPPTPMTRDLVPATTCCRLIRCLDLRGLTVRFVMLLQTGPVGFWRENEAGPAGLEAAAGGDQARPQTQQD